MSSNEGPDWLRWLRSRMTGDRDRLGWWTLPAFLIVGLAGAVLAGSLTVVWYSQQVDSLRDEIRDARGDLRDAVDKVQEAGDEALAAIGEEVAAVQEQLAQGLPVDDAGDLGLVQIRATVGGQQPSDQATQPAPQNSPAAWSPTGRIVMARTAQDPSEPPSADSADPEPAEVRNGVALPVAVDGDATFLATVYELVVDPQAPGGVMAEVEVITAAGTFIAAVHSWDEERHLALLRAELGSVPIPRWRPEARRLQPGDRAFLIGWTVQRETLISEGVVSFANDATLLTDLSVSPNLRGSAIVDSDGNLIGLAAIDYRPDGEQGNTSMVPVRLLCAQLLTNCAGLDAPDEGPSAEPTEAG